MGFFDAGYDKKIGATYDPMKAGLTASAGVAQDRAAGNSARTESLWNQEQTNQGRLGGLWDQLQAGGFDDPGQAARAVDYGDMEGNKQWWKQLGGTAGQPRLKDATGKDITTYGEISNEGMMTPEQKYAMRERAASADRSGWGSAMDKLRSGGMSNPAQMLAMLKGQSASSRSGNLAVNSSIADMVNNQRQWGYGKMEGAKGQEQSLDDAMRNERTSAAMSGRAGRKAGLSDYLALTDRMGGDWATGERMTQGQQSLEQSGWGGAASANDAQQNAAKQQSMFQNLNQLANTVGNVAGAFSPSDINFKHDIKPGRRGLSDLRGLKTYNYTYIDDLDKDSQQGILAQELERVCPEFILQTKRGKFVNTYGVLAMVIEAIKELDGKVNGS
jgi:hypothetical protein